MNRSIRHTFLAATAACGLWLAPVTAQTTATTDPVGASSTAIPAGTDANIAASFRRPPAFSGLVGSILSDSSLQVSDAVNWQSDEFAMSHYVQIESGNMDGAFAVISSNTANGQVSLSYISENFSLGQSDGVQEGDAVSIIPLWTLGTFFGQSDIPEGTEVLLFDRNVAGINNSSSQSFVYYSGFGWYDASTPGNDQPLYPDESFVLRTPTGSPVSLAVTGEVNMAKTRFVLSLVESGTSQDIRIGTTLPVPIALQDLVNPGSAGDGDEILFFDNDQAGVNKSSVKSAVYYDGFGWYDASEEMNNHLVQPGDGIIYRKAGTNTNPVTVTVPAPSAISQ